ncbi:MAG: hypothetical protein A4S09_09460 [Proteobacteria bacterium SG_bin7]|nr:MAG: hypothetical protein A4S09_09460 [Proteobacteria bacterium SG_bin7]
MRIFVAILLLITGVSSQAAPANRHGDLGLGVMVGDTTSLTGKYWTKTNTAFDLSGGGSAEKEGWIQASYEKYFLNALSGGSRAMSEFSPYVGFGLGVGFNRTIDDVKYNNDYFARVPLGLSWLPNRTPVDIFLEAAPTMTVEPEAVISLVGNVGARYYF